MRKFFNDTPRRVADAVFNALMSKGVRMNKNGTPRLNPLHAKMLYAHKPSFWTGIGPVNAMCREVTFSKINGETIAYFDLIWWNPASRLKESTTIIYAVRGGEVKEIKRHETRYSR